MIRKYRDFHNFNDVTRWRPDAPRFLLRNPGIGETLSCPQVGEVLAWMWPFCVILSFASLRQGFQLLSDLVTDLSDWQVPNV